MDNVDATSGDLSTTGARPKWQNHTTGWISRCSTTHATLILVARFIIKMLQRLARTLHASSCGVREKTLNGVDKYLFTSFQQRRQHLPAAHHDHDHDQE
jgi:hypothetical protein